MTTEAELQDLLAKLDEERSAFLATIEGLSEEDALWRPPDDVHGEEGWSAKEQLSHLAEMESSYRAWVLRAVHETNPDVTSGTVRDPVAYPLEEAERHTLAEHRAELTAQDRKSTRL